MASLAVRGCFGACISGPNVLVYRISSSEKQIYKIDKQEKKAEDIKDEQGDDHVNTDDHVVSDDIMAAAFSTSGRYFAACNDRKQLALWDTTGSTWISMGVRALKRRCLSLTFTYSEDRVIVADKSGDAYTFSVTSPKQDGALLLGHVSMLLDLVVCGLQDALVATADRDEKIRVSHLPNAYNVHTFCLGHSEFVTRLLYLPEEDILVSGSGDGTVRLWDYNVGKELHCADCKEAIGPALVAVTSRSQGDGVMSQSQGDGDANDASQGHGDATPTGEASEVHNADVKCLAFDNRKKILAVGCDRSPTVLLYHLKVTPHSHTLSLLQRIDLGATLWDLTFDLGGDLWVLKASRESTASVFRASAGGELFMVIQEGRVPEDDPALRTVQAINSDWDQFKDCPESRKFYTSLHKPKLNSTPRYYERKQKRLEEGEQRKGATTHSGHSGNQPEIETKKPKMAS